MSNWIIIVIGAVIIIGGFIGIIHTTSSYDADIKKEGTGIMTSPTGQKIWEHWGIEAIAVLLGFGVVALGKRL